MKNNIKRVLLASFVLAVGFIGFTPSAKASSSVSFSYTETNAGRPHQRHYNYTDRWTHKERKFHRKALRKARKAEKRALRRAVRYSHARHRVYHVPSYVPARRSTVVYQNVTVVPRITPVSYDPSPLLAKPASSSYLSRSGQTCREYQSDVTIGNRIQSSYGTACLQSDGAWRIVE